MKIGYSRADRGVEDRVKSLQCGNPRRLHLLAVAEGGQALERKLHRALSSTRIRNEWFKYDDRMKKIIKLLEKQPQADLFLPHHRIFNEHEGKKKKRKKLPSARTLRRREATAAFEKALADGSMIVKDARIPTDEEKKHRRALAFDWDAIEVEEEGEVLMNEWIKQAKEQ